MNWLELKTPLIGSGKIYLLACTPLERAYRIMKWLKEHKPFATVIYAGEAVKIKEWQAEHWVEIHRQGGCRNYLDGGKVYGALNSLQTALQAIEQKHQYTPTEIVIVRAKQRQL